MSTDADAVPKYLHNVNATQNDIRNVIFHQLSATVLHKNICYGSRSSDC